MLMKILSSSIEFSEVCVEFNHIGHNSDNHMWATLLTGPFSWTAVLTLTASHFLNSGDFCGQLVIWHSELQYKRKKVPFDVHKSLELPEENFLIVAAVLDNIYVL